MLEYAPPRVTCADHGVTVAMMPWARRKSTYTRDFEQQTALLNVHAPRSAVSRLMRMDWKSVGPVCRRVADDLRAEQGPGLFDGPVLLQCLFDRFGSVFPQCGLMVFPGVVIVSR
ncbi:transposase family protein [Bifidobacterium longum]|uniref:transposase family protein n=1 Tax=Bifidobacterium longum TaxID=216816 RepID=UPI0018A0328F|nr:transposase family protein [Bifidobacterium longum]MDB6739318.1 transposase family protein [Bifidobacterium longum]